MTMSVIESFIERWLWYFALVLTIILLAFSVAMLLAMPALAQDGPVCETYRITGYVRGAHSARTYDGTSVWTRERIAAASWNVPIDAYVQVVGLGSYRIADRGGGLGPRHIDILTDSVEEAYALTGWRTVCVYS
jgi:3D (Asp-Asp-Asp) domain-containing protein